MNIPPHLQDMYGTPIRAPSEVHGRFPGSSILTRFTPMGYFSLPGLTSVPGPALQRHGELMCNVTARKQGRAPASMLDMCWMLQQAYYVCCRHTMPVAGSA